MNKILKNIELRDKLNAPKKGNAARKKNMKLIDIACTVSNGNRGAISVINGMYEKMPEAIQSYLECLDDYGIRGERLWCLYNKCCRNDYELLKSTIRMFKERYFSQEDIDNNLNPDFKIFLPFMDDFSYYLYQYKGDKLDWDKLCINSATLFSQKIEGFKKAIELKKENDRLVENCNELHQQNEKNARLARELAKKNDILYMLFDLSQYDVNIGPKIINNGEFPFEQFGTTKNNSRSYFCNFQQNYQFYYIDKYGFNGFIKIIDWSNIIEVNLLKASDNVIWYSSSRYLKKEGKFVEIERNIKLVDSISYQYQIKNGKISLEEFLNKIRENNIELICSKRIVRDNSNPRMIKIDYYDGRNSNRFFQHAYESLLMNSDDNSLSTFNTISEEEIKEKIVQAENEWADRKSYRESILEINNNDIYSRNMKLVQFVKEGLTFEEICGAIKSFVNNLPFSLDPTKGEFIPGEVFMNMPIDLNQLNHESFDMNGYKTIAEGMRNWGDTSKSAQALYLFVFFQQMLLDGKKEYTVSDVKKFMLENKILRNESDIDDIEYKEYINNRNKLLMYVAEHMVKKVKNVRESQGFLRNYALLDVFKEISRVSGPYGLCMDLDTYYYSQHINNNKIVNFNSAIYVTDEQKEEAIKMGKVLSILNSIYYGNNDISLNSKRLYMINVATNIIKDKNQAIKIIDKYYRFNGRKIDISPNNMLTKKR